MHRVWRLPLPLLDDEKCKAGTPCVRSHGERLRCFAMASSVGIGSTVFLFLLRLVKEEEEGLPRVNASETSRSSSAVSAHWRSRTDPTPS
jgi:hypothetical protein